MKLVSGTFFATAKRSCFFVKNPKNSSFVLNFKTKYIKADPSPAVRTRNEIDMALSQQRFGLSYVVTNFPESFVQVPTSKFHLLFHCFTFCCYLHFSLSLFTFQEFQEYLVHHFRSKQHLWTDKVK